MLKMQTTGIETTGIETIMTKLPKSNRKKASETLLRHWAVLKQTPEAPDSISVTRLVTKLEASGFIVTERTIQRDLNELSETFDIECLKTEGRKGYWCWKKGKNPFERNSLDPRAALTFALVDEYIRQLFPTALLRFLDSELKNAQAVLKNVNNSRFKNWKSHIAVIPDWLPVSTPELDTRVRNAIFDALLYSKKVTAKYRKRGAKQHATLLLDPVGFLLKGTMFYVVAFSEGKKAQLYALNRFESAQVCVEIPSDHKQFELEKFVKDGEAHFSLGEAIELEIIINADVKEHLTERPLSNDQKVKALASNRFLVTAMVPNTKQLRWWLAGFGGEIEVVKPKALRTEICSMHKKAVSIYST